MRFKEISMLLPIGRCASGQRYHLEEGLLCTDSKSDASTPLTELLNEETVKPDFP